MTHGFALSRMGINVAVDPGQTAEAEFTAQRPGTYWYYCTWFCSALHLEMRGRMLVKPRGAELTEYPSSVGATEGASPARQTRRACPMSNPIRSRCAFGARSAAASTAGRQRWRLPLWQMRMEAPQYRDEEALKVVVYPSAMRGDLNEITVLNQYIGVHIPKELPQLKWLPAALIGAAALGWRSRPASKRGRRWGSGGVPLLLALALARRCRPGAMANVRHRPPARLTKPSFVGVQRLHAAAAGHQQDCPVRGRPRGLAWALT